MDLSLKYAAIANDNIQVTEVYATDGLNRQADLKILEDDLSFFPEYNGAYLVRADIFEKFADEAPNLKEVLNMLGGRLYQRDYDGTELSGGCGGPLHRGGGHRVPSGAGDALLTDHVANAPAEENAGAFFGFPLQFAGIYGTVFMVKLKSDENFKSLLHILTWAWYNYLA